MPTDQELSLSIEQKGSFSKDNNRDKKSPNKDFTSQ